MLSFIRKKLSDLDLDITGTGVSNGIVEHPVDMNSHLEKGEDALLKELGYNDQNDLKETIYGEC